MAVFPCWGDLLDRKHEETGVESMSKNLNIFAFLSLLIGIDAALSEEAQRWMLVIYTENGRPIFSGPHPDINSCQIALQERVAASRREASETARARDEAINQQDRLAAGKSGSYELRLRTQQTLDRAQRDLQDARDRMAFFSNGTLPPNRNNTSPGMSELLREGRAIESARIAINKARDAENNARRIEESSICQRQN